MAVENLSLSSCWSCHTPFDGVHLFCPACHIIQPTAKLSPFSRYGLIATYDIDLKALEKTYLKVQQILHPDKFVSRTDREKLYSSQQTMEMNMAYEILKDDVKRAEALLQEEGVNFEEKTIHDPHVLMMSMEDREALDEATETGPLEVDAKKRYKDTVVDLKKVFEEKDLEKTIQKTLELKYLGKFLNDIKDKKRKLRENVTANS